MNVLTRPAPLTPTLEASLEGGAYGYARLLASGGGTRGHNGMRADLNITRSDNWKQDAPFKRQSGTLRWDLVAPGGWTAKTVLTGTHIDQQDVPALSHGAVRHEPLDQPRADRLSPACRHCASHLRIEHDQGATSLELHAVRALRRHAAPSVVAAHLRPADVGHEEHVARAALAIPSRLHAAAQPGHRRRSMPSRARAASSRSAPW